MKKCDVVLLNPPFYRVCNSHNDRMPLSLCYLSSYLENEGISHIVYNADFMGSDLYWSMKRLFDNFESFIEAVDDKSPLYDEVIQKIISTKASVVVIMGADPLVPTKDLGSPFIAANFSRKLRKLGIFTIGIGPYFTLDSERFKNDFDSILAGEPSQSILDIIKNRKMGVVKGLPISENLLPNLTHLFPVGQKTDSVITSFGCFRGCVFCVAGKFYKKVSNSIRYVDIQTVAKDILNRAEKKIYLLDLNFSACSVKRLKSLCDSFRNFDINKEFVVESRVDDITTERMLLFKELGVTTIKLGIEGLTNTLLTFFEKKQSVNEVKEAVRMIKSFGMKFIAYILIGGVKNDDDYEITKKMLMELEPDHVVVSIWAYQLDRDYRYDTQFSPVTLKNWGIKKEIFYDFLALQKEDNPTVGKILR